MCFIFFSHLFAGCLSSLDVLGHQMNSAEVLEPWTLHGGLCCVNPEEAVSILVTTVPEASLQTPQALASAFNRSSNSWQQHLLVGTCVVAGPMANFLSHVTAVIG